MHVVHKTNFVIFLHETQKMSIIYYILCLAAEGDTAEREAEVSVVVERGIDAA